MEIIQLRCTHYSYLNYFYLYILSYCIIFVHVNHPYSSARVGVVALLCIYCKCNCCFASLSTLAQATIFDGMLPITTAASCIVGGMPRSV